MIPVLLVSTEEHTFAFRREDVEVVTLLPRLERRPSDMDLLEGWFRLGAESLPTMSLARVLGMKVEKSRLSDHLVVTVSQGKMAWRVRKVIGLDDVAWNDLSMVEHSCEPTPCYVASFERDGQTVFLLNVGGLLLVEERERLRESAERKRGRLEALERADSDRV